MYITVSRCGVWFWDNQPCATRWEEDSKVYVERVSGSFQHLTEREDMVVLCSFEFVNLAMDFTLHFGSLSLLPFFCQSPNSFSLLSSTLFFLFDIATLTTSAAIITLGTINLCKCTQLGFSFTFLNGTGVCAQGTPLISFLSGTEVGGTPHQPRTHSTRLVASH